MPPAPPAPPSRLPCQPAPIRQASSPGGFSHGHVGFPVGISPSRLGKVLYFQRYRSGVRTPVRPPHRLPPHPHPHAGPPPAVPKIGRLGAARDPLNKCDPD